MSEVNPPAVMSSRLDQTAPNMRMMQQGLAFGACAVVGDNDLEVTAVAGSAFGKVEMSSLPKDKLIMIVDNEPRNKDICRVLDKIIENRYNVVIWPQTINEKDINEMVLKGSDPVKIVSKNVFSGLEAKLKFVEWKRC